MIPAQKFPIENDGLFNLYKLGFPYRAADTKKFNCNNSS